MINAKYYKPRVFPWNSIRPPEQIDRSQDIGGDLTLNREKVNEIGREKLVGWIKKTPNLTWSMTQEEYGSMSFWRSLANKVTPGSGDDHYVDLDDFKSTATEMAAFLTDDNDTFVGSIWFPKLRVSGFSLNVSTPDAIMQRKFDLVGEDFKIIPEKYFSYETATSVTSGEAPLEVTLSPIAILFTATNYIFRVLRIRSGVVTEIAEGTGDDTYAYSNSTHKVTVQSCLLGDVVKVFYPSDTAYTTTWTDNNSDPAALIAENCEILMKVGTSQRIYRLQSVGLDVKFDRTDYREIGNSEMVQFGVKDTTVTISLDRYAENFSLEEILAGDPTYPYINPRDFVDNIQLMVKVYNEKEHSTFKIGYLMTGISPASLGTSQAQQDYGKMTNSLTTDNMTISDEESEIVFS